MSAATENTLGTVLAKLLAGLGAVGTLIPERVGVSGKWTLVTPDVWVSGFYPGILMAAYGVSGDPRFLKAALPYLDTAAALLRQPATQSHDLGFQLMPGCVGLYKLTGNPHARQMALRGADMLRARFQYNGNFIQAWSPQPGYNAKRKREVVGKAIIDTMMNLPLLFWASQETGDASFADIASMHVATVIARMLRADGSTFHQFRFDPFDGAPLGGAVGQGYSLSGCWSRGHAWGVYGLAHAAKITGRADMLAAAVKAASFVEAKLPPGKIPLWDYSAPGNAQPIDSSAAAITVCGLYVLADLVTEADAARWRGLADAMLAALIARCDRSSAANIDGLLSHGAAHVPNGRTDEVLIYGDFFYLEALLRAGGRTAFCW